MKNTINRISIAYRMILGRIGFIKRIIRNAWKKKFNEYVQPEHLLCHTQLQSQLMDEEGDQLPCYCCHRIDLILFDIDEFHKQL